MNLLSNIKTYALIALSVISSVLLALFYRGKYKTEKMVRKATEQTRMTEQATTKSLVKGLAHEAKARDNAKKLTEAFRKLKSGK